MTTNELYENFLAELDRSLIVDEKTREYWLKNYKIVPATAVEFFYEKLLEADSRVDNLIAAGIDADPQLSRDILQKGKNAKKKTLKYLEKESTKEENPEEFLKSSLT